MPERKANNSGHRSGPRRGEAQWASKSSRSGKPSRTDKSSRADKPSRAERKTDTARNRYNQGVVDPQTGRVNNPADLRRSNRPDREKSPDIDEDVTGEELDRGTRIELQSLETRNQEWAVKHLVMAGRLLDTDPELAFQHALAASRRGGRLAPVREAVGITAYAAGHYAEALREFRTYRRISGVNDHLPLMADCERGLGRPQKALEIVQSPEAAQLPTAARVELAIVESGARRDLAQYDAAVTALEIPQLDKNRAYSFSPRLFAAYAEALAEAQRTEEAEQWRRRALIAENALASQQDPEIVDLAPEDDDEAAHAAPAKDREAKGPGTKDREIKTRASSHDSAKPQA